MQTLSRKSTSNAKQNMSCQNVLFVSKFILFTIIISTNLHVVFDSSNRPTMVCADSIFYRGKSLVVCLNSHGSKIPTKYKV